ncbi:hypothetical protein [Halobacillus kuroshimensis]|uniref:hypothetical protein n=1 Tax=Halobacillus kuroshimensis TaxID=302481 RepID=UPI001A8CB7D2|nr:hypothetical protein [Halobacillus kuroshimensis]
MENSDLQLYKGRKKAWEAAASQAFVIEVPAERLFAILWRFVKETTTFSASLRTALPL